MRNSFSTSAWERAEVGSSMTMRRDFIDRARAISTSCCSATESSRTSVMGSASRPRRRVRARVSSAIRRQLTKSFDPGSRPMKTFSQIVMFGARVNSW